MRYAIIILIFLLTGCSAQWHLEKALEKKSDIIDIQADTTMSVNISYKDTSIYYQKPVRLYFQTDTARKETEKDTVQVATKDSTSQARGGYTNGMLWIETWGVVDTTKIIQDTLKVKQKIIDSLKVITTEKKATIREKESWIKTVQRWAIIVGIVIFALAVVLIVRKFS